MGEDKEKPPTLGAQVVGNTKKTKDELEAIFAAKKFYAEKKKAERTELERQLEVAHENYREVELTDILKLMKWQVYRTLRMENAGHILPCRESKRSDFYAKLLLQKTAAHHVAEPSEEEASEKEAAKLLMDFKRQVAKENKGDGRAG